MQILPIPTCKTIRLIPILLSALVCGAWADPQSLRTPSKLNILVLLADDWRFDTLGCMGNPVVKTPNLDKLAGENFQFTHNCVTTSKPRCSIASALTMNASPTAPKAATSASPMSAGKSSRDF
jgi:hypothetical protein